MAFSVGGLASGLDTKSIIDQMLAIDGRPKVRLEWNKALWEARRAGWNDLNTRLGSLGTFATTLLNPSTWSTPASATSSNAAQVTASVFGTAPTAGTYAVEVSQLATVESWAAGAMLAAPTSGVRATGVWYGAKGVAATNATLLTDLRDQKGMLTGLDAGSTITMAWTSGGTAQSAAFAVTATSTMADLNAWAQAQMPGSTVALAADGTMSITSPPGTTAEATALSFSAVNSAGTALARFDGSTGAASTATVAATDGGAVANDTLTFTQGASTWSVNVLAGWNEYQIADAINATTGIGITASVSGGALQLTSKTSGSGGAFTVASAGTLATDLALAQKVAAQDAMFTVDGVAHTSGQNTGIKGIIADVSLDLLAATAGPVTLTVEDASSSTSDTKKKIMDFVNQYNSVIDFIASKTAEQKVTNPKNLGEYLQGPLARDFRFGRVAFDLRSGVGDAVEGLPSGMRTLADIGITTGAIGSNDRSGKLVVDEAKLDAALANDAVGVRDLLTKASTNPDERGIVRQMSELVSQMRLGGAVESGLRSAKTQVDSLQNSIERWSDRLDRKRLYYERMFTGLESSMGRMQSQSNWLSGQFQQLSY